MDRRFFIGAAALAAAGAATRALAQNEKTRLILLGTKGGPAVASKTGRNLAAQVILARGVPYVIDCGLGVTTQLARAGIALKTLRHIFITHQHSDHNLELGGLIHTAWNSGLTTEVDVWGPPPISEMTRLFFELNKFDIETRIKDEGRVDPRPLIHPHDLTEGGVILQTQDIKVSVALVPHPPVKPAFAYRFDAQDRSIVISGDTAYSEALIKLAKGADVLVHETMYEPAILKMTQNGNAGARELEHLKASHTTTEEVGRVAKAAGVKQLVLSHLVPGDDPTITDAMWLEGVRKHYKGPVIIGRDLMEI